VIAFANTENNEHELRAIRNQVSLARRLQDKAGLHDMQMSLAASLGVSYARFQDVLSLLDELTMEVYCIIGHAPSSIVFAEDVLGCLLIVSVRFGSVALAFL
jgi:hypothetical protein